MAQLLNIPATTYRGYENSARQPDFETLLKISDILGVPVDTLLRDSSPCKLKNIRKTFSAKLKSAREKKGVTQQALAEQIGISAVSYTHLIVDDCMACVTSSLETDNDIRFLCQHICDFPFSFIAPIGANYCFYHLKLSPLSSF